MATLEFVGQSSQDPDNVPANPSRLLNCYREFVGGRSNFVVKSVLGTQAVTDLPGAFMRAMAVINGTAYIAHAGTLYKMDRFHDVTALGAIVNSPETTISGNNGKVTVCAGGRYYVWNGATLTEPVTGAFSSFGSVTFFGQLTVLTELGGRRVQWSGVADPTSLGGLDFATAEQRDDAILRALPVGGELWFFKEGSTERWYQNGADLAYIPGTAREPGLKAFGLLTETQNGAFFVGSDNKAYIAGGGQMQRVSTIPVETSISSQDAAACFYYQDEGHEMCVIVFSDRPAWCFDLTTQEWHERGEGHGRWTATAAMAAYGKKYIGTLIGGVQQLVRNNADVSAPLVRTMVSRTLQIDANRFRVPRLVFQGRVGAASVSDEYDDSVDVLAAESGALEADWALLEVAGITPRITPQCMLRVSGDHGRTWGKPRTRSIGNAGEQGTQIVYRNLGQFRAITVELSCSEPIDVPFDAQCIVDVA